MAMQRQVAQPGREDAGPAGRRVGGRRDARQGARRRADGLEQHAGQEQAEAGPQRDGPLARLRLEVARVVRGVRVPAHRVAERRAELDQERAGDRLVRRARVALAERPHRRDQEDHHEHREGVPLEDVDQVVAEERHHELQRDHDQQAEHLGHVGQRVQRERAADAVDREPADAGDQGVDPGGQGVAPVAEAAAAQHHLRYAVLRALGGQDALGDRAERGAEHDREERRPEAEAEERPRR